jgi:hypothetical protein
MSRQDLLDLMFWSACVGLGAHQHVKLRDLNAEARYELRRLALGLIDTLNQQNKRGAAHDAL